MTSDKTMFLNTPIGGNIKRGIPWHTADKMPTPRDFQIGEERLYFWITNHISYAKEVPIERFILFDSAQPDAERERLLFMQKVRAVDQHRNQTVVAMHADNGHIEGRLYPCIEAAMEDLLYGNCSVDELAYGDVFVNNDSGAYELAFLSNKGRAWLDIERANPTFQESDKETEYRFRVLSLIPGYAVVLGDLDGQLYEYIEKKNGAFDSVTV